MWCGEGLKRGALHGFKLSASAGRVLRLEIEGDKRLRCCGGASSWFCCSSMVSSCHASAGPVHLNWQKGQWTYQLLNRCVLQSHNHFPGRYRKSSGLGFLARDAVTSLLLERRGGRQRAAWEGHDEARLGLLRACKSTTLETGLRAMEVQVKTRVRQAGFGATMCRLFDSMPSGWCRQNNVECARPTSLIGLDFEPKPGTCASPCSALLRHTAFILDKHRESQSPLACT